MVEGLTLVPRVREVRISNPGPAKSYTALQTVRHRFKIYVISSCVTLVCNDVKMGTASSLHASASYGKYNEKFFLWNNVIILFFEFKLTI